MCNRVASTTRNVSDTKMTSSGSMKNPTVHGFVCNNIIITKSEKTGVSYGAFQVHENSHLCSMLLDKVRDDWNIDTCIIGRECMAKHCSVHWLDKIGEAVEESRLRSNSNVTEQTLQELYEFEFVFNITLKVSFKGLSVDLDESLGEDVHIVSYKSCAADITSVSALRVQGK